MELSPTSAHPLQVPAGGYASSCAVLPPKGKVFLVTVPDNFTAKASETLQLDVNENCQKLFVKKTS